MPFFIPAIIAAAAAVGSGIAGAVGSSNAASAQKDSANRAMDIQREVYGQQQRNYEQSRNDMAPWLQAGQGSLGELMAQMHGGYFDRQFDPSQLANDPGYQFRMQQGQQALERSASARGLLNSGGALKSLARYSQGVASDEFQNAWGRNQAENTGRYNRLAGIAGVGQQAGQNLGNLGMQNSATQGQYANNMGQLNGALGNAAGAGHMGMSNAVSGGLQTLGGLAMMGANSIPTQGGGYGGYGYSGDGSGGNGYTSSPADVNGIPYYLARQ